MTKTAMTFTDLNDAYVIGSALISLFTGGEAVHIDGTVATGEDIEAAKMGMFVPVASGSAVKKAGDAVEAGIDAVKGGQRLPDSRIIESPAKRGNAPIGDDGNPIELHHRNQTPDGPVDEMTRTDHRIGGNYGKNHSNTGQDASLIDRDEFRKQRELYWKKEWDSGRFGND